MGKVTSIIITKNEEKMIEEALKSLEWSDEIIVVDTGNTDKTNEIAKKYKARVVKYNGKGSFADWRNLGMKEAKEEWVFYLDADERVIPALRYELKKIVQEDEDVTAYAVPRRNFIFGKEFKHSGQYPDYQKRFFKQSSFKKWNGDIHEEPNFEGRLEHLKNPLMHYKKMTITQMVEKTNKWSEIEARLMMEKHHPKMNIPRFFTAMAREFWLRMVVQLGFLDGPEGIIYAIYQVFSKFTSYAKLYEMQLKVKND